MGQYNPEAFDFEHFDENYRREREAHIQALLAHLEDEVDMFALKTASLELAAQALQNELL